MKLDLIVENIKKSKPDRENMQEQGGKKHKNELNQRDSDNLKELLQKAVNAEKAPNSLHKKISKIFRNK